MKLPKDVLAHRVKLDRDYRAALKKWHQANKRAECSFSAQKRYMASVEAEVLWEEVSRISRMKSTAFNEDVEAAMQNEPRP